MQPRNISLGDKDSSVHSSYSSAFAVAQSTMCFWSLSSEGFISAVMRWHGFCQEQEHAELLYHWHLASWAAGALCEHCLGQDEDACAVQGEGTGPGEAWLVVNLCRGPSGPVTLI